MVNIMKYAVNRVTGDQEFLLKFYVHSVNVDIRIFFITTISLQFVFAQDHNSNCRRIPVPCERGAIVSREMVRLLTYFLLLNYSNNSLM